MMGRMVRSLRRRTAELALAAFCSSSSLAAQPSARFPDTSGAPRPDAASSTNVEPALARASSWATERALALTAKAERYARRGDVALALAAYNDAIRTDATFGPAYLGLARVRESLSDFAEAERLYLMAAELPDSAPEARARRAALLKRNGREAEAMRELEESVRLDPSARAHMRELTAWYVQQRAWAAALAASRRLLAELEHSEAATDEIAAARVQVRALTVLAADLDPVQSAVKHPSWVRRSLASVARRGTRGARLKAER